MERTLSNHRLQALVEKLKVSRWTILSLIFPAALLGLWRYRYRPDPAASKRLESAKEDPPLLRKHTTFESYLTPSGHTYPRIRTFYKQHGQAEKLPKDVPLLVFIHGLGGSASQFGPLLTSMINSASCLALDLPGCGRSDFAPAQHKAYTTQALAELVATATKRFLDAENGQKVVLIGHSMGCSINALLASSTSPLSHLLEDDIVGMIAICPRGASPTSHELSAARRLTWMPLPLFDLFRWYDRRGALNSASVTRMTGPDADEETRKLQLKFNEQSQSSVFLRIMSEGLGEKGMPGREVWSGVKVPLFLVAGEADKITPAAQVELIGEWLTNSANRPQLKARYTQPQPVPTTAGDTAKATKASHGPQTTSEEPSDRPETERIKDSHTSTKHAFALKTTVFPYPASHALLYSTSTVRILSGMLESFLSAHIDQRLGRAWQLQHLTTSGKWDVKNLAKWQSIDACSEPIAGIFRAMKTMREIDEAHCPREFVKHYSWKVKPDGVAFVVDISHESPVYHPKGLEEAGVEYVKFPTVSKEKPKAEEVDHFIHLIDKLRESPKLRPRSDSMKDTTTTSSTSSSSSLSALPHPTIAVHCHYGFNRTGFFLVCYLVEREGWGVQDAIEEFARKRPPGIKHEHFVNELFVRYAVRFERRGTVVG